MLFFFSDIDECVSFIPGTYGTLDLTAPCLNNGTCIDQVGTYTCDCGTGYLQNYYGKFCQYGMWQNKCDNLKDNWKCDHL